MSIRETFAQTFRTLKEKNRARIDSIACDMRVHPDTVKLWYHGATMPSVFRVCALAQYFNVSVDYLLTGKDNPAKPDTQKLRKLTTPSGCRLSITGGYIVREEPEIDIHIDNAVVAVDMGRLSGEQE